MFVFLIIVMFCGLGLPTRTLHPFLANTLRRAMSVFGYILAFAVKVQSLFLFRPLPGRRYLPTSLKDSYNGLDGVL